jgi:ATP-dependent exoDNAse (exonuclease V) alpha subunit
VVGEGTGLPLGYADRFEVYRPAQLTLAAGDRIRITRNGSTKDKKHDLDNGALFTVKGFTPQGDLIVDHNWVVGRDFGHIAHGVAVTSMASQGRTVDKVFIGLSSDSFPATNQRSFYVPVGRGKEQALVFTDSKKELLRAIERPDQPLSATELMHKRKRKPSLRQRLQKQVAFLRRAASFAHAHERRAPERQQEREMGYGR